MRKLCFLIVTLASALAWGQTHTFPAEDTNNVFTGTNQFTVGVQLGPVTIATLPTGVPNGTIIYASDGLVGSKPCTGGSSGAVAELINGIWSCGGGGSSSFYQTVQQSGTSQIQEPALNLIPGSNIALSCMDNSGVSTNCTITSNASASFYQTVQNNTVSQPQEPILNIIPGTNITLGCTDTPGVSTNCTLTGSNTSATAFSAITAAANTQGASNPFSSNSPWTFSVAGQASTPGLSITGAPFLGTGTTGTGQLLLGGGTAATTLSTNGTELEINAPSGFAGNLADFRVNGGTSVFGVAASGSTTATDFISNQYILASPSYYIGFTSGTRLYEPSSVNGTLLLTNATANGFSQLSFGAATSSFTALQIAGTTMTFGLGSGGAGGTFNFGGTTQVIARNSAGLTTASNGDFGYDTTANNWHGFQNSVDSYLFGGPAAATYNNGNCAQFNTTAGGITLVDAGFPCGSGGGSATITLVQKTITPSGTCSSTSNTCTIAVSSTGAGHAGVILAENATGSSVTISSISGWTIPSGCHAFSSAVGSINCAYNLSLAGGVTSFTVTWSSSTPGFSRISFYEYSTTGTGIVLDAGATPISSSTNSTSTTPAGVTLAISGTSDVIVQAIATSGAVVNSVATPYSAFLASSSQFGSSNYLNTSTSPASTWTLSTTSITLVNGIALQATGGGGSSAFSALTSGTNGSAAMVVGTGASLATSGSGSINATLLGGATFASPGCIGCTTPGIGDFSAASVATLNNVQYADRQLGSDPCAKILAAINLLPSTGGVVNALGFQGTQATCAASPFAGVTKSVQLYLGAATFPTNAQWIVPEKSQVFGVGRGDPGSTNTVIQAGASFPVSTAVVLLGPSPGPNFGVRVENLTIDCNNISGAVGLQNLYAEEQSTGNYILLTNCPGGNVQIASAAQNSGPYNNLEVINDSACTNCTATTVPVIVDGIAAFRGIRGLTINSNGAGAQPNVGLRIDAGGSYTDTHCEHVTDCVVVGSQAATSGTTLVNTECGPTITTCVEFSNAFSSQGLSALGTIATTGNLLVDQILGNTLVASTEGGTVAQYTLGNGSPPTLLTSSTSFTSSFASISLRGGVTTGTGSGIAGQVAVAFGTTASIPVGAIGLTTGTSGTAYQIVLPSAAANGTLSCRNAANVDTCIWPYASDVTAQSTSQSTVTLATPSAGGYRLNYYATQNATCTTGSNSVSFTFNWTDAHNARSLTTGSMTLSSTQSATTGYLSGLFPLSVGSGSVTYTSTVSGTCATGTSSYDVHVTLENI